MNAYWDSLTVCFEGDVSLVWCDAVWCISIIFLNGLAGEAVVSSVIYLTVSVSIECFDKSVYP